ncbi:MAG: amino acid adenylation domain-containing protein [Chloroflexota bacterium]
MILPQTKAEKILAGAWTDLLGIEDIGVHSNFFEIGGHSLRAVQLITRLREQHGIEIGIRDIFRTPALVDLAKVLDPQVEEITQPNIDLAQLYSAPFKNRSSVFPVEATENTDFQSDGSVASSYSLIASPLKPVGREKSSHPVSAAQRRIWFLEELEEELVSFNLPFAVRLQGELNKEVLRRSVETIINRHEALRTTFTMEDGRPVQVIGPEQKLDIPVTDISDLLAKVRERQLTQLLSDDANRPFDLAEGPLFRTQLIRLAKEEHVFLFNVHHIVFDGWSLGCLYRELDVLYATYLDGKDASLPELPAQYVDFTYWQNERLESPELQRQLAYWTEQLAGAPPLLELPTDMPRPARQQYKGAALQKRISGELTTELRAFSHQQGASLFMTLFAGFQTLLHRYADQDDILIGSPVAGRNLSELEPLMGMFVNTLVLRTNFEDDPTFLELLQQVSVTSLDAFEHQEVPFEKLVEALQPQRSRSYSPLFQIMFVLQNTPQRVPDYIGTLGAWEETVEHRASMLDMTLYITELDEGMDLWLEYNTSLFAEKTIMRMLTHFEALLHGILQTPTARVSTIPLLSEAERERILIAWNDTSEPYPEACLHTLFDDLAIKMTNSVAAIFPSSQLTYGDLQKRSNQLANYLLNQGLSKGTLVGICAERSPEMLVGILGVLKAGGAYVPLDPYYPPDRLGFMMEDSGLSLLLTQQVLLDSLPKHNAQILCLDRDWRKIANSAQTTPAAIAQLDDPAYIIYTSGSTGSPKGVMGVHRATVNRCQWMWRAYPFRPDEVCSQKTSLNFVDSIWEIFGPLLQGIPTVYIPDAIVKDLNQFIRKLAKERVTRLVVVPSLLNTMLDAVPDLAAQLPKLSIWITSGETLTVELAAQFKRQLPDRLLLNLYGSSEVAADVTYYEVNAPEEQTVIPIGQPIANAQIYLVDTAMQPVPVGVVGELYVGGDVLAAGYLNRPELTDERFVPNPFGENESYLLYKTGDLGRYRSDGQIEYVGRTDHQVKIRGFRIELGEVESTLVADKQIQQAIVMVRAESSLGPQLVAYVVSDNEDEVYVKSICQQALPEYMVPSHIVFLTEMPLTPNGKVDRVALQSIELTMTQEETYVAPRNNIEEHLVYIWESLLDVRPIGVKDNFFDLGGHSLLAVQFLARVRDLTGEELALTTLLDSPSIERIANTLMARMPMDDETEQSLDQSVPPAREMTINGAYVEKSSRSATDTSGSPYLVQFEEGKPGAMPIFCVHGAGGNVLVLRELSRRLGADIPFYGIQARGVDGVSRPHSSIEGMAQAYINAIQTLQLDGPFILAGYSGGGTVAYEMARRLQGTDSQVPLVVFLDTFHPGIGEETTPLASHIKGLSRQGGEYLISKLTDRLEQRRVEKARKEKLTKLLSSSATIPIELRDYHLASNFITAMDHYSPRPYSGRILLFRAAETWPIYAHAGPDRGWSKLIPGLTIQEVPGDHENLILEPNVKTLAEAFKQSIDLLVT